MQKPLVPGNAEFEDGVPGCYALEFGAWSRQLREPFHLSIPDTIRLETVRGTSGFERSRFVLRPRIPFGESYAFGTHLLEDSIRLVWTTGFSAVVIRAASSGRSLTGTAEAGTDVVGPMHPTAEVIGVKVPCPASLRHSARPRASHSNNG